MRTVTSLLMIALLTPAVSASAQERTQLVSGQRIRVTAPDGGINKQIFTFESWREDSLLILADAPLPLHLSAVTKLERSRGRRSFGILKGAGLGFLIGAAGGAVAGVLSCAGEYCELTTAGAAGIWAGLFGVCGAAIGGVAGALVKTERWEEVSLDRLRPKVIARWRAVGLALHIAF